MKSLLKDLVIGLIVLPVTVVVAAFVTILYLYISTFILVVDYERSSYD